MVIQRLAAKTKNESICTQAKLSLILMANPTCVIAGSSDRCWHIVDTVVEAVKASIWTL
jgi:hypothetical protein